MPIRSSEVQLVGDDVYTTPLPIRTGTRVSLWAVSVTGGAVLTLQRRKANDTVFRDVEQWAANFSSTYVSDEKQEVRLGFKTGDNPGATPTVRIGRG